MLQDAIMAKALLSHCNGVSPRTLLDLGAGDGLRPFPPLFRGGFADLCERKRTRCLRTLRTFY